MNWECSLQHGGAEKQSRTQIDNQGRCTLSLNLIAFYRNASRSTVDGTDRGRVPDAGQGGTPWVS